VLKTIYLKSVDSTQIYLKTLIKYNKIQPPYVVVADIQSGGVGSRGNSWDSMDGNLFLSFAISLDELPRDLKLESVSIYFAYLLKETLCEFGSALWLKWPNDFYLNDLKIGGMITNIVGNILVCGIGLNLLNSPKEFGVLDIKVSRDSLLERYFKKIEKNSSWKQVFSKYKLEFCQSHNFFTHVNDLKFSLDRAVLQNDGSILCNGERIYSLR